MALRPPTLDETAPADRRLAELYRAASTEEPPWRLDSAVRAAAHSAGRRSASRPAWWLLWRIPFAVAAVAVVSGSLALLMYEERPEQLAEAPAPAIALSPPAPTSPAKQEQGGVEPPMSADPSAFARRERSEEGGSTQVQRPRALSKERAAADMQSSAAPSADVKPETRQDSPAPAPPPAAPAASTETSRKQERAAVAGSIGMRGLDARDMGAGQQGPESGAVNSAPTRAAPAAPTIMAAPPPAEARARSEVRAGADITAIKAELEREPPPRWVERIAALRRAGRQAEAEALAAEFRRRFPDEPLPTPP